MLLTSLLMFLSLIAKTLCCGYFLPKSEEVTIGGSTFFYSKEVAAARYRRESNTQETIQIDEKLNNNNKSATEQEKTGQTKPPSTTEPAPTKWTELRIETEYNETDFLNTPPEDYRELQEYIAITVRYYRELLKVKTNETVNVLRIKNFCESGLSKDFLYTDYAILVKYESCSESSSVQATAAHCDISEVGGVFRPVAGKVTVCSNQFSRRKPQDKAQWLGTLRHEMMHALVFSTSLYPYFASAPNTTNKTYGFLQEIPGIVQKVTRNWMTATGTINHEVWMIASPKVKEMAQKQFNCPTLEGAELENQGADGTRGSHWEKRIFEHETMTGVATQVFAMTNISLALFEDSGWYQVDYSKAEPMEWGHDMGCDFAMMSCLGYMNKMENNSYPFCKQRKGSDRCSKNRRSKMICSTTTDPKVPDEYNYITPKQANGPLEQGLMLADYCPYYREFQTETTHNGKIKSVDTRCTYADNFHANAIPLEVFSDNARCLTIQNVKVTVGRNYSVHLVSNGCYETRCDNGTLWVKTQHSKFYPCYKEDQLVHVLKDSRENNGGRITFEIVCPRCSEVCSPSECVPQEPPAYVGDPKAAPSNKNLLPQIITIFAVLIVQ